MVKIRNDVFNKKDTDNGIFLILLYIHIDLTKVFDNTCYFSISQFLQIYNLSKSSRNVSEVKKTLQYMIDTKHISIQIVDGEYMDWEYFDCVTKVNRNDILYLETFEEDIGTFKKYADEFVSNVLLKLRENKKMYKLIEVYFLIFSKMWFMDNKTPMPCSLSHKRIMEILDMSNRGTVASYINKLEELNLLDIEVKPANNNEFNKNVYSCPKWLGEFQEELL